MASDFCESRFPHTKHSVGNDYFFIPEELNPTDNQIKCIVLFTSTFIGVPVRLGLVLE